MRSTDKAPASAERRLASRVRRSVAGVIAQYIRDLSEQDASDPCPAAA
jgi:hypothetical protein